MRVNAALLAPKAPVPFAASLRSPTAQCSSALTRLCHTMIDTIHDVSTIPHRRCMKATCRQQLLYSCSAAHSPVQPEFYAA